MPIKIDAKEYWSSAPQFLGENLQAHFEYMKIEGKEWVVTESVNQDQSYVLTPFNAFYHYGLEELHKMKSQPMRLITWLLIHLLSPFLKYAGFVQVQYFNNWLFSTILYPSDEKLMNGVIQHLSKNTQVNSPKALSIRSLNPHYHSEILKSLVEEDWLLVPTRQVWIFDQGLRDYAQSTNSKHDLKLLKNTDLTLIENHEFNSEDFVRIQELYRMLYIDKYSVHNPDYSLEYLIYAWEKGLIHYFGFKDQSGVLQAVGGRYTEGKVSSNPIVGYNTQLDPKLGLYRLILIYPLKCACEAGLSLHGSSGAPQFKKSRGATPFIEYSAVYISHLNPVKRLIWRGLACLLEKLIVPYMKKHEM